MLANSGGVFVFLPNQKNMEWFMKHTNMCGEDVRQKNTFQSQTRMASMYSRFLIHVPRMVDFQTFFVVN